MVKCMVCDSNKMLKCTISCCSEICFLCIKINRSYIMCTHCNKNNFINTVRIITFNTGHIYQWVYASVYSNTWWCYDPNLNKHIEGIYKDYITRLNNIIENNSDIEIILNNTNHNIKNIICTDQFSNIQTDNNNDILVNFEDYSMNMINNHDEDNKMLINFKNLITKENKEYLSYTITISNTMYEIDFEKMRQINKFDSYKQRRIKRILIPPENILHKKEYLVNNYNIIGISGIKFDLIS